MRASRLVLAFVLLGAGLSACSVSIGGSDKIDHEKAEKFLSGAIHPAPKSVTCPSGVKIVKGATFLCKVVTSDGQHGTVVMHMTNSDGDVHVQSIDRAKAETFLLDNLNPRPTSVICPDKVVIVKGGDFVCTAKLPGGKTATVTVHMTDSSGAVHVGPEDIHNNS